MAKFFESTSQAAEREKRAEERERRKLEMLEFEHASKLKELELKIAEKLGTSFPPTEAMPQIQHKPPPELNGEPTFAEFKRWELKWKDYSRMVRLPEMPLDRQQGILRSCLSPEMHEELVYGMGIPDETPMTVDQILLAMRQFIRNKKNVSLDRFEFHSCKQQEGETVNHFYIRLKRLAEDAELCANCCDDQITSALTVGLNDQSIRMKLLSLQKFPRLEDAIKLCRSEEAAKQNDEALSHSNHKFVARHKQEPFQGYKSSKYACKCGKYHQKGQSCSHFQQDSKGCKTYPKKPDRFIKSVKVRKVKSLDLQPKQNNCKGQKTNPKKPDCFIKSVKVRKVNRLDHPKAPTTIVQVCPESSKTFTGITALPDSGADVSIAGPKLLSQLKIPAKSLKKPEIQVFASNGTKSNCTGYIKVMLRLGNKIVWDKIYICSEQNGLLLSWYTSKGLHILPGNYPCQIRSGNFGKSSSKPKFKSNHETHRTFNVGTVPTSPSDKAVDVKKLMKCKDVKDLKKDKTPYGNHHKGKSSDQRAMGRALKTQVPSKTLLSLQVQSNRVDHKRSKTCKHKSA